MIILGIHDGHNSSAAILKDGMVIACASEERFSRIKNDLGHPARAIDFVLSYANIQPEQIDMVALATRNRDPIVAKIKRDCLFKINDYIREMHEYWRPLLYENKETNYWNRILEEQQELKADAPYNIDFIKILPKEQWEDAFNKERIRLIIEQLNVASEKIHLIDHHVGHASYAYYASPNNFHDKAAIITADSWGDGCNATISIVSNGRPMEIHRTSLCNIARIYRWTTLLLGMKPNEHEYKVMGLAPYSKDYIREPAYKIYKETLVVDGLDFRWRKKPPDMYFYFRDKLEGVRFDGIAAGLQLWMEDLLSEWVSNIMTYTKTDTLYYSGGLSMNVKANKVIAELPYVKKIFVPPSGSDESLAMGSAFALSHALGTLPIPIKDTYLGFTSSIEEVRIAVQNLYNNPDYKIIGNPGPEIIVEHLLQGKILGRCIGRMEFGARSLGNRAIICDPSRYENIRIINEKIKFRDFWMPFTPSILYERANDYIVNSKGLLASYMTIAFESTPLAREHLKAAIHPFDFTVRPQLVSREMNPEYYFLIKAFESRTGIGAILNTSLNLHGHPIVCTAEEAIETFIQSGLDGMILQGILILKNT